MDEIPGRRLIIMRHAKSSWNSLAATDHDRPLNKRGQRDAPRVAQRLAELGWRPQIVVSSDSQRTRQTWERMQDVFTDVTEVQFLRSLYHAGPDQLIDCLVGLPPSCTTVLALGHNPGWQESVAYFSGESIEMTTANAALLQTARHEWSDSIGRSAWQLHAVIRPREL